MRPATWWDATCQDATWRWMPRGGMPRGGKPRVRMPLGGGCHVVGYYVLECHMSGCSPIPVDNSDDIGILDSGETVGNRYHTPALGRKQKHIINKIRQNGIIHNQLAYNFSTPGKIDRMNV